MALAARGRRETASGQEQIEDQALVARLRAKARGIPGKALLIAAILTAAVLVCPG